MLCYFDRVVIQAREINENTLNAVPFRTDPDYEKMLKRQLLTPFITCRAIREVDTHYSISAYSAGCCHARASSIVTSYDTE